MLLHLFAWAEICIIDKNQALERIITGRIAETLATISEFLQPKTPSREAWRHQPRYVRGTGKIRLEKCRTLLDRINRRAKIGGPCLIFSLEVYQNVTL